MRTMRLVLVGALGVMVALGVACSAKRPPAVLSPADAQAAVTPDASTTATPEWPQDDLRAVGQEGLTAEDLAGSYPTEEGGPLADIYFDFDQATLTDAARTTLEKHAAWLQTHREAHVLIEGHCDERGTVEYNLALGDKRAQATRDYLVSLGVPATRMATVSLGKERPIDAGHDETAWARNRRAHFAVKR
jgi:peptidoglycan-associated lipoprotein